MFTEISNGTPPVVKAEFQLSFCAAHIFNYKARTLLLHEYCCYKYYRNVGHLKSNGI